MTICTRYLLDLHFSSITLTRKRAKAIRRSEDNKYWNIRKIFPRNTSIKIFFLATMYIYEYHKEHGIVPKRAKVKHFATDTVMIKRQMTFRQISELLDVPVAQQVLTVL
jgi:membrane-bound lytic murein transglycosylase D